MILSVWVVDWALEEDQRTLRVGDPFRSWLTFGDADRLRDCPPDHLQTIQGLARSLPRWPGAEDGRHPVAITVGDAMLYWDAPRPIDGPIDVTGSVSSNSIDAPDGFPDVRGVIRRVRTDWQPVAASETDRLLAPVADARTRWTGCLIDLDLTTA